MTRPSARRRRSIGDNETTTARALARTDVAASRVDDAGHAIGLTAGTRAFTKGIGGAILGAGVLATDPATGAGSVISERSR